MSAPFGIFTDNREIDNVSDIVMQYTGLKDKNGKEIYEGDVVEVERQGETWGATPTLVRYEVKFADGAFYTHREFTVNENKRPILANWGEVIGNIYEHPKLLPPASRPTNLQ